MGLYLLSGSSYKTKDIVKNQPNPENFKILDIEYTNNIGRGWVIATVKYPNCTTFEGKKILVFKDIYWKDVLKADCIDPHFFDRKKNLSLIPFARFEPTSEGFQAAKFLCENYK